MNIKRNIIFSLESRKKNGVPIVENVPIRMRVVFDSHRIEFTTGYRIDVVKMGCRQATCKERMYQQTEAKRIGNQCGLAGILHRNPEYIQGV